jgi:hypothetical protein
VADLVRKGGRFTPKGWPIWSESLAFLLRDTQPTELALTPRATGTPFILVKTPLQFKATGAFFTFVLIYRHDFLQSFEAILPWQYSYTPFDMRNADQNLIGLGLSITYFFDSVAYLFGKHG